MSRKRMTREQRRLVVELTELGCMPAQIVRAIPGITEAAVTAMRHKMKHGNSPARSVKPNTRWISRKCLCCERAFLYDPVTEAYRLCPKCRQKG